MDDGRWTMELPDSADDASSLVIRRAARVILIDSSDRILLFRIEGDFVDAPAIWLTPGGGLDDGESFEQAAQRELWEETGLEAEAGVCVWTRHHVFPWRGVSFAAHERFFVVRCASFEPVRTNWTQEETAAMVAHRWWSIQEIVTATGEVFVPRRLAVLLPPILAGELPSPAIDCGV